MPHAGIFCVGSFLAFFASIGLAVAPAPDGRLGVQSNEVDALCALSGMPVYALTVRTAEQFRHVVEARAPGTKVSLLHDLDASKRLEQHARQADLFILVTAPAKHAATDCVRASRPAGKPLIVPLGKGAASMLAAVRGHFEQRG